MKLDNQLNRAPGFTAFQDGQNAVNKVVYSSLKECEARQASIGIGLKYVQEGEEHYEINGRQHTVRAGQFLMVNHGQEVYTLVRSSRMVKGLCLYVDPQQVAQAKRVFTKPADHLMEGSGSSAESFEVRQRVYPVWHSPLENLIGELLKYPGELADCSESLFWYLSGAIYQNENQADQEIAALPAKRRATREELHQRLMIAKSFILDNLSQPLMINEVAREAALSEFHFIRTFRQAFGLSPNQFLQQERIRQAKALLQQPHLSITDIAAQCGFSDLQYFSRTFKRITGEPPSRFRTQNR